MQAGRHGHVDEGVEAEQVNLAAHHIGDARLRHPEPAGGFPLGPALTLDLEDLPPFPTWPEA
jgi:hypothetical protein